MNILQALRSITFVLPKQTSNTEDFPIFLENCFKNFIMTIDKIDEGSIVQKIAENREFLEQLCNSIVNSIKTYFNGFPAKSYYEFESAINLIEKFLLPSNAGTVVSSFPEPYYRARIGSNIQYEKHEMFHVPFEMREIVSTKRFSIPGFPCLYLSNSTYVCWEELRKPDVNKLQVSRFKLENNNYKFLDISLTPELMCRILENLVSEERLKFNNQNVESALNSWDVMSLNFIMKWPLIAACSIKVKKQEGIFKPEYIIPQFLLQWVTHNKMVDGIKYFSIEANMISKFDYSQLINYAIPAKKVSNKGYCEELKEAFSLTDPISWEIMSMINPNITEHNHKKFAENVTKLGLDVTGSRFELIKGKPSMYFNTVFGKLELELSEMDFLRFNY